MGRSLAQDLCIANDALGWLSVSTYLRADAAWHQDPVSARKYQDSRRRCQLGLTYLLKRVRQRITLFQHRDQAQSLQDSMLQDRKLQVTQRLKHCHAVEEVQLRKTSVVRIPHCLPF